MANPGKLTAVKVAKLTKRGAYGDGGNLYLQISQWGTKAWIFRYTVNGRARTMGLGDVSTFSLKEARDRARDARQLLADGIDPLDKRNAAKQAARIEAAKTITFKDAAEQYIKAHEASWKNPKHRKQWASTLATYAYPVIGDLPVAAVDTGLVMRVLEPIWLDKTETASRLRGRIESVLGWATVREYRKGDNPARWGSHLENLLPQKGKVTKVRHQEAMPYAQVPEYVAELRANPFVKAKALEFTILTATRTGEVIKAQWDEFNFDENVWIVPGTRTKSGRELRVPLCDRAIEILNALPREKGSLYVFPGNRARKPLSQTAMLYFLQDKHPGLTVHGFRSSFRDWAAEMTAFPREIAEAALGHVLGNKVEAAYQRGDLLLKRRKLMDAWANYCARPAGNGAVIPMRKAAEARS